MYLGFIAQDDSGLFDGGSSFVAQAADGNARAVLQHFRHACAAEAVRVAATNEWESLGQAQRAPQPRARP